LRAQPPALESPVKALITSEGVSQADNPSKADPET